jgi:hypothetical protein
LTQFRLRRLIRLQAEHGARITAHEADRQVARSSARRLVAAARDLRDAWAVDVASAGPDLGPLRRHVTTSLAGMEITLARLGEPGMDVARLTREFREVALPLLFFLRGLEGCTEEALATWLAA